MSVETHLSNQPTKNCFLFVYFGGLFQAIKDVASKYSLFKKYRKEQLFISATYNFAIVSEEKKNLFWPRLSKIQKKKIIIMRSYNTKFNFIWDGSKIL